MRAASRHGVRMESENGHPVELETDGLREREPTEPVHFREDESIPICSWCGAEGGVWTSMDRWEEHYWSCASIEARANRIRSLMNKKSCWEILELKLGSTTEQIELSFRRLSFIHHPDYGGTNDDMRKLLEAREQALSLSTG